MDEYAGVSSRGSSKSSSAVKPVCHWHRLTDSSANCVAEIEVEDAEASAVVGTEADAADGSAEVGMEADAADSVVESEDAFLSM